MSTLLHEVLQPHFPAADNLAARLDQIKLTQPDGVESATKETNDSKSPVQRTPSPTSEEEELIAVQSVAVSPRFLSRASSRSGSRAHSPTRPSGAASRRPPGPLLLSSHAPISEESALRKSKDPLKFLPTDISQRVFAQLSVKQLARCARVSRKWAKSQTINYIWFQHYRKENFHDESLPAGKWTRRESKQNWRTTYLDNRRKTEKEESGYLGAGYYMSGSTRSGTASYAGSGWQTPREVKEERWKADAEVAKPAKNDMREMYKELGGRKSKAKAKFQTSVTARDKGGWAGEEYDGGF